MEEWRRNGRVREAGLLRGRAADADAQGDPGVWVPLRSNFRDAAINSLIGISRPCASMRHCSMLPACVPVVAYPLPVLGMAEM